MRLEGILEEIEGSADGIAADLSAIIRVPAIGPMNGGAGECERADLIQSMLDGFDSVTRVDVPDEAYPGVVRPNILAVKRGRAPGTVWIVSHMDTVLPGDLSDWTTPPYEPRIEDGKVYGLGAEDNGQAVMSSIYAAKHIPKGSLEGMSLGLAIVCDEETKSTMGIGHLVDGGFFSKDDMIVVPDWGSPGGSMIEVAEKHLLWLKVAVEGRQTHGSTPNKGVNAYRAAIEYAADLMAAVDERFGAEDPMFLPPASTFEPTKSSGTVGNVNTIPGRYEMWFDCRIIPRYDPEDAVALAKDLAREHSARTGAEITAEVEQCTVAGKPSDTGSADYAALKDAVESVTGVKVAAAGVGGGTCANFFRLAGYDAYVWESEGGSLHRPNEFVRIANVVTDAKVFATLFYNMCVQSPKR